MPEMMTSTADSHALLNAAAVGIYHVDKEDRIRFVNNAAAEMLGWPVEDLLGRSHHEALRHSRDEGVPLTPDDCPLCRAHREGRRHESAKSAFCRANGSRFPVEYVCAAYVCDGQLQGSVVTFRDVSEHHNLQNQLVQSQKLESIGQLAAGIAHEINTPIQYINDNTRFLQDAFGDLQQVLRECERLLQGRKPDAPADSLDALATAVEDGDVEYLLDEIPTAIAQSLEGIERVATIVRALKEFSHPVSTEKTLLDVHRAIDSTITIARNEWKYVAEVATEFAADLPQVPCLPGELNQVLLNLVINAAHAISEKTKGGADGKGLIKLQTRCLPGAAEIRISDTGTGIPEAIRSKVFDLFFTTKPVGQGTGQGLAFAHSVVCEKHQGSIDFETEPGVGTTFIIRLPLSPDAGLQGDIDREETHPVR